MRTQYFRNGKLQVHSDGYEGLYRALFKVVGVKVSSEKEPRSPTTLQDQGSPFVKEESSKTKEESLSPSGRHEERTPLKLLIFSTKYICTSSTDCALRYLLTKFYRSCVSPVSRATVVVPQWPVSGAGY